MTGKIIIKNFGGPEVLEWTEGDVPKPGPGEVLIKQTAVGLNFIDVYHREGLYPMDLPLTPGVEAAGVIETLGEGVEGFKTGDQVAYFGAGKPGAYAEYRVWPTEGLIRLPDNIDDQTAAGMMLKGATAEYLIRRTFPVKKGDWVLFHAASGGVGSIATQWLKSLGAKVIGTVGSEDKAALARANGCADTILYRTEDIAARVKEITEGRGVDVVFDGVGKDTFEASLNSLKPRGMLVSFGNASGPVPEFKPLILAAKGSLYLTRPTVKEYYASAEDFAEGTKALLEVVSSGKVKISVNQTYSLKDAGQAHRDLESRKTTGSTVLLP
ncbi:MAG: quinone oxidoreductase family protein [Alphaproteobacteria bacterium]